MSESKETKTRLVEQLNSLAEVNGRVLKVKRGDNKGPLLGKIYIWQEAEKYAKDQLKAAWKAALDEGIIDTDDKLREDEGEERIVMESDQFTAMVKVGTPAKPFSKEKFIEAVAKKYKIDAAKLEALATGCTKDSAAPLSKRIVEV